VSDKVLVDSNVLIDILQEDDQWFHWSSMRLAPLIDARRLVLDPIVYAEVSIAYASIEELEGAIAEFAFERQALPWEAAFLAGKVFERYRRRGGVKRGLLHRGPRGARWNEASHSRSSAVP
jgi:hypothetical protein